MGQSTRRNKDHRAPRSLPCARGDSFGEISGLVEAPQPLRVGVPNGFALRLVVALASTTENTSSVCV